eukprot:TRINITY_DN3489_c0_g3_i1.p1 TRINITY_DN3489_c0_g3~~TRINITY_DN3489_c0_g3_i1.p1  ORF type:complete len:355 (-),score=69.95 TRINITY_DN3489_c0_g3_i1:596-1555(-)
MCIRDRLKKMLERDSAKRITIPEILNHRWVKRYTHDKEMSVDEIECEAMINMSKALNGEGPIPDELAPLRDRAGSFREKPNLKVETKHHVELDLNRISGLNSANDIERLRRAVQTQINPLEIQSARCRRPEDSPMRPRDYNLETPIEFETSSHRFNSIPPMFMSPGCLTPSTEDDNIHQLDQTFDKLPRHGPSRFVHPAITAIQKEGGDHVDVYSPFLQHKSSRFKDHVDHRKEDDLKSDSHNLSGKLTSSETVNGTFFFNVIKVEEDDDEQISDDEFDQTPKDFYNVSEDVSIIDKERRCNFAHLKNFGIISASRDVI